MTIVHSLLKQKLFFYYIIYKDRNGKGHDKLLPFYMYIFFKKKKKEKGLETKLDKMVPNSKLCICFNYMI